MRAIGFGQPGPLDRPDVLVKSDQPRPTASGRDLLVAIRAVSVNPVDVKLRGGLLPMDGPWHTLGFDAAGVVVAAGPDATLFQTGDEVIYAGSITRPGTNSEFHLVDERIVGRKPSTLNWAEAAALPLTTITAWETLFDRLDVRRPVPGAAAAVLVIGGAGGVGSMAVQLARQLTELTVIATASRPETRAWVQDMGAHHILDHSQPLAPQVEKLGLGAPGFVFCTTHTDRHLADVAALIAPQGRFALIDEPAAFDIGLLKPKSVSVHWELMFTRSLFGTPDMDEQGRLLTAVADLVEAGKLRSTLTERLSPINVANMKRAHGLVESAAMRGKLVLEGWE